MTYNVLMETLNPTDSTQLVFTCAKLLLCSDVLTTGDLSGENQRPVLCCRLCSLHRWNVALNCSSLIRSDVTYVPLWRASAVNGPKAHFALPICFLFFLDQLYWTSVSWHSQNFLTTRRVDLARKSYVLWALLHAKKWRPKTAAFLALFPTWKLSEVPILVLCVIQKLQGMSKANKQVTNRDGGVCLWRYVYSKFGEHLRIRYPKFLTPL